MNGFTRLRRVMLALVPMLVIALVLPNAAHASTQMDLIYQLSADLHEMARTKSKKPSSEVRARATRLLMARTEQLLKAQGLGVALKLFSKDIREEVEEFANDLLRGAKFNRGSEKSRLEKANEILIDLTTDTQLTNLIARWMGTPPVGGLESPEGEKVEWNRPLPLEDVEFTQPSTSGPTIQELTIASERGGTGEGNGRADPGEWVQFNVMLHNDSPDAWFSTSAFLKTGSKTCMLVQRTERELTEMDPRGKAGFSFWAYFSHQCKADKKRVLYIDLQDTHHPRKRRLKLSFSMPQSGVSAPIAVNAMLDGDIPGSSDGSGTNMAAADQRLEFSHGIRVETSRTLAARIRYTLPKDQKRIVASWHHRHPDMIRGSGRTFAAGDDVDLLMASKSTISKAQSRYRWSRRWFDTNRSSGTLWVAADVETWVGQRKAASVEPRPSTQSPIPTAEGVLKLINQHMEFVSRDVAPKHPNAIAGVAGHDVVIDMEGFTNAYRSMIAGKTKAATPRAARYLQRLYIPIPMKLYQDRVAEPDPEEPRAPYKPLTRIDLGVGATFFSNLQPASIDVWSDKSTTSVSFEGRISVGRAFTGILQIHTGSAEPAGIHDSIQFEETAFGLGLGYIFPLGSSLEIHPRALFTASTRLIGADELFRSEEKAYGGEAGITLRYWFTSWLGAHLDVAYLLSKDAPSYQDDNQNDKALMDGMAPRFSGGLSTFF